MVEAADLDEALAWGRKAAVACRTSVEVRPVWAVSLSQRMILFQNLLQTVAQQLDAVAQRILLCDGPPFRRSASGPSGRTR
jgi:uncharacterized membrane protein